jgi:hypothetical protein
MVIKISDLCNQEEYFEQNKNSFQEISNSIQQVCNEAAEVSTISSAELVCASDVSRQDKGFDHANGSELHSGMARDNCFRHHACAGHLRLASSERNRSVGERGKDGANHKGASNLGNRQVHLLGAATNGVAQRVGVEIAQIGEANAELRHVLAKERISARQIKVVAKKNKRVQRSLATVRNNLVDKHNTIHTKLLQHTHTVANLTIVATYCYRE